MIVLNAISGLSNKYCLIFLVNFYSQQCTQTFWTLKHMKTEEQVTFLVTNPRLWLVTALLVSHPLVWVMSFYPNTLYEHPTSFITTFCNNEHSKTSDVNRVWVGYKRHMTQNFWKCHIIHILTSAVFEERFYNILFDNLCILCLCLRCAVLCLNTSDE